MHRLIAVIVLAVTPVHAGPLPIPEDAELPTADHFSARIHDHLGATATARVEVCTASNGHVDSVKLLRGSHYAAFDHAVVTDVAKWDFTPSAAPRCFPRTIAYHTSR